MRSFDWKARAAFALALAASAALPQHAFAQFFFRPFAHSYRYQIPDQEAPAFASRRAVASIIGREGYRLVGPLGHRGEQIVVTGVSRREGEMRFIIDPYEGRILRAVRLGARPMYDRGPRYGGDYGPGGGPYAPPPGAAGPGPVGSRPAARGSKVPRAIEPSTPSPANAAVAPGQAAKDLRQNTKAETPPKSVSAEKASEPAAAPQARSAPAKRTAAARSAGGSSRRAIVPPPGSKGMTVAPAAASAPSPSTAAGSATAKTPDAAAKPKVGG